MIQEGYRGCVVIASCRLQTTPCGRFLRGSITLSPPLALFWFIFTHLKCASSTLPTSHCLKCECGRRRRRPSHRRCFVFVYARFQNRRKYFHYIEQHRTTRCRCWYSCRPSKCAVSLYITLPKTIWWQQSRRTLALCGRIGTEQVSRARLCWITARYACLPLHECGTKV